MLRQITDHTYLAVAMAALGLCLTMGQASIYAANEQGKAEKQQKQDKKTGQKAIAENQRDTQKDKEGMARGKQREERRESPERADRETAQQPAWLGVLLGSDDEGVRIERVFPGSPAEKAGLEDGDVIKEIAGQPIESPEDAGQAVQSKRPGAKVKITVLRDERERTFTATLAGQEGRGGRWNMGRPPFEGFGGIEDLKDLPRMFEHQWNFAERHQRVERLLDDLREELNQLREEVDELKKKAERQDRR